MVRLLLLLLSVIVFVDAGELSKFIDEVTTRFIINAHNSNPHRTFNMTYYEDFSALTPDEFDTHLGLVVPAVRPNTSVYKAKENFKAPDSVDWRKEGVVSPVKNQNIPHICGSCWAFSAVGALEGQHALKRGKLVQFSEQNVIDCSTIFHAGGCRGSFPDMAFFYVKYNKGIDTEASYPYKGIDDRCHFKNDSIGEVNWGFVDLPTGEDVLKNAVAEIGPISVCIQANFGFKHYKGGVFYDPNCGTDYRDLNHAVLLVGYGTDPEQGDYWLVKNSWGEGWGEKGYARMARNRDNNCGIANLASFPIIE